MDITYRKLQAEELDAFWPEYARLIHDYFTENYTEKTLGFFVDKA